MKNYTKFLEISGITCLLGIVCLLFLSTACTTQQVYQNNVTNTNVTTPTVINGRVVMTVTDAAANMNNVTDVNITINSVAFHSQEKNWVTVSSPKLTYDLVALKLSGNQALLTDLSLPPAHYDQIRLEVSGVTVTDANGTHDAMMPSNTLLLNGEIVVLADKTSTASFDFILDQSLYTTTDNRYVFAPVIQFDSRTDGNADTTLTDNVILSGGTIQTSSLVGMDVVGNLVIGGNLPPILHIDVNDTISGTQTQ